MSIDPGWKGQPDDTEREPTPCEICGGKGYLENQGYDLGFVPDDYISVQRCDSCQQYPGDDAAAKAFAQDYDEPGVAVHWFDGEQDMPGDYAIGPITKEHHAHHL